MDLVEFLDVNEDCDDPFGHGGGLDAVELGTPLPPNKRCKTWHETQAHAIGGRGPAEMLTRGAEGEPLRASHRPDPPRAPELLHRQDGHEHARGSIDGAPRRPLSLDTRAVDHRCVDLRIRSRGGNSSSNEGPRQMSDLKYSSSCNDVSLTLSHDTSVTPSSGPSRCPLAVAPRTSCPRSCWRASRTRRCGLLHAPRRQEAVH